jgi:uncharacterized protein (DUF488 family)
VASTTQGIYTIGHSTRTIEVFIGLLKQHGVEALADVRRFPKSRRHPHFNDEALALSLPAAGIVYMPFPSLGGRRKPLPAEQSPNHGWDIEGFRGYADFMLTPAFEEALAHLEARARELPTAIMCAEAVYWRCHRRLISDALLVRGWEVLHIGSGGSDEKARPHVLPDFAHVEQTRLTYPGLFPVGHS